MKYAGWQIAKIQKEKERFVHSEAGFKGKKFRKCISPYVKVLFTYEEPDLWSHI